MGDLPQTIDMLTGLHEIAERRHLARQVADLVFSTLPEAARLLRLTRDGESGQLFYDLPGIIEAGGAAVWANNRNARSLDRLFDCIMQCVFRLERRSAEAVFKQLGNLPKHLELLEELGVVLGVPDGVRIDYEARLLSESEKSIDWQLTPPRGPIILLDVKARVVDLVSHFEKIAPQLRAGAQAITDEAGPTDARPLFRSLEEKFPARPPDLFLQGAWIAVNIKHEEQLFVDAFRELDGAKVHFALMVTAGRKAYVLKRHGVRVQDLQSVLRFEESRDAIMER
jgi:hypothetical protein